MTEVKEKENKTPGKELGQSQMASKILIEPWITESSTADLRLNKYVFKVGKNSNKQQIKKSIEELYKVKVLSVNTINIPRKFRNYGRTPGWKAGFKKAVVTLEKGDSIELIKGI